MVLRVVVSTCQMVPATQRCVKPLSSRPQIDQVFSLDDVRKVVRQELFCAHRGRGRRGNGSERRRAGKQVYWVAEKKRRQRQASDERVRRRDSTLARLTKKFVALNVSVAFGAWRQFARLVSSLNKWKSATILSVRRAALSRDSVSSRATIVTIVPPKKHAHTRRYQMVLRECKWMVLRWRLNRKYRWRRYLSFNQPCIRWRCSFCRHFERTYEDAADHEATCTASSSVGVGVFVGADSEL